ncbi:MAG: LysE family translocator, partial [Pseudomonadota bacterium]
MENLPALIPAILALMSTPGPVTLASAAFGAAVGWRAWPWVLMMTLGTGTVILLVATGVTGLVTALPGAAPVILVLAAAYFLWLAWRIGTAPPIGSVDAATTLPPLWTIYVMAVANPKAFGAMGALFSAHPLLPDSPVLGAALKGGILFCCALTINHVWMVAGAVL